MADAVDVYSDQMQLNVGPIGAALIFSLTSTGPVAPGVPAPTEKVAVVRISLEHLKMIAYFSRRQVLEYERQTGVRIPIPRDMLNQLRIGPEDWTACWGEEGR